jgi:hypothetical protein
VTSANEIIWPGVIAWSCEISVVRTALLLSRLLSRFHLIAIVRASSRHRRMPRQSNDARKCQRRTGGVISNQARFRREQVTFAGKATAWVRRAESGNAMTFHFCPICGSTVYWEGEGFPEYVAVAIGNFADPNFPAPTIAVWEESRHSWVSLPPDMPPKHATKQG